jgi:branched-chain amino acid aminotransferase
MRTSIWTRDQFTAFLQASPSPDSLAYYAMYSSQWEAIVCDPACMLVPVDDHLVHRGDGVFETVLCEEGAIYNLQAHLDRLRFSAASIGLEVPYTDKALKMILVDTFQAAGQARALGRILLGRGPGGFSVDPHESPRASFYAVVYKAPLPFMERVPGGAKVITSSIPPKSGGLASIKTCNYIPNALMKAEAVQAGAHFALGVDAEGFLTESYTENVAVIDGDGCLIVPPAEHHLAGTTLKRVAELAAEAGIRVRSEKVRPEELFTMREVLLLGTTAYVSSVVELNGKPLPCGPVAAQLSNLLRKDIAENTGLRTAVF